MTTPPAPGSDPEPPGARRGLESYPEFFAYQKPYTPAPTPSTGPSEGVATAVYPETYIKDKAPARPERGKAFSERQAFSVPQAFSEPQAPAPLRTRNRSRAPGRRRAKRSLAKTLWPFQAFTRAAPPNSKPISTPTSTPAPIRSRSTTETVWRKLRADRAAVFGGCTIVVLVLLAVFAPAVAGAFGVSPTALHPELTDATFGPHGGWGGISWAHPLGVDQRLGRDILARLLFGARVSLLIAGGATLLSVGLGVALGIVSGYLGGNADMVIMRVADVFLAFPLVLFALGLTGALSDQAFGLSGNGLRIAVMIFVMGFFNWPYIARIVRAEVLSLRGREFVDAARAMGATTGWILRRELLPNLLAPILVYTTLLIPANIVFEAGLSALGIGLDPPASSWGQMMTDAVATVYTDPEYLIVPGMAVFITVLAFNLFGDGLRNATDPTAQ